MEDATPGSAAKKRRGPGKRKVFGPGQDSHRIDYAGKRLKSIVRQVQEIKEVTSVDILLMAHDYDTKLSWCHNSPPLNPLVSWVGMPEVSLRPSIEVSRLMDKMKAAANFVAVDELPSVEFATYGDRGTRAAIVGRLVNKAIPGRKEQFPYGRAEVTVHHLKATVDNQGRRLHAWYPDDVPFKNPSHMDDVDLVKVFKAAVAHLCRIDVDATIQHLMSIRSRKVADVPFSDRYKMFVGMLKFVTEGLTQSKSYPTITY